MANALVREKSPYLQQHAENPVDWLPWGQAAFDKAQREDKPIFLSIGYSTCHWCHVMAHESFENESVAAILNRDFVPVKVDREERPDVDRIYMLFVQASTGSGGWPMSVWLTPQLKPFFGGTYFPPQTHYGRPGFADLLQHLANAWRTDRQKIEESSVHVTEQLRSIASSTKSHAEPDLELFESGFWHFRRMFDSHYGGFGSAPKFPRPAALIYLLRHYSVTTNEESLDMVTKTLRSMAAGGMHDHLGGGFHRYSVDERWFVPHFEKMLYDQAQLAIAYLETFQITRDEQFASVARDIFTYLLRDMRHATGGFYSAEDADSPDPENPGHAGEGAFYIWRYKEIETLLGPEASAFCEAFGVEKNGNVEADSHGEFTGRNILYEAEPGASRKFTEAKRILFEARAKRPRPHLDRKILTAWNALAISAFAKGFSVLGDPACLDAGEKAAAFLLKTMYDRQTGVLLRRYFEGDAAVPGFLDDYAFLAAALLDLFEVTGNADYLKTGIELTRHGLSEFWDSGEGGFFSTSARAPDLMLRLKDDYDGAEPAGNSVAADVLLRLAHLTGEEEFKDRADKAVRWSTPRLRSQPTMAPQMLATVGRYLAEPEQVVLRSAPADPDSGVRASAYRERFAPYSVVLNLDDDAAQALQGTADFLANLERKGRMTIYECRNFTCELPQIIT
jgi:uncharacterized protein YyaL (SSP411 family)